MTKIDNETPYIVFPNFYMYRCEYGWRWVSRDATRSSPAAFEYAPACALDAERSLSKVTP